MAKIESNVHCREDLGGRVSTVTKGAWHAMVLHTGMVYFVVTLIYQNFVIFTVRDNNILLKNYSMFRQIIFPVPAI